MHTKCSRKFGVMLKIKTNIKIDTNVLFVAFLFIRLEIISFYTINLSISIFSLIFFTKFFYSLFYYIFNLLFI